MTFFTNFSGHPSASVPAGMIDGRLPVGMQIIGGRYDDAGVLTASRAFEQLRPWDAAYELCRDRPARLTGTVRQVMSRSTITSSCCSRADPALSGGAFASD